MQLKTERLSIRPFEVEDKEDIFEIYEDEETCRFLLHETWTERDRDGHFERKRNQRSLGQKSSLSLAVLADDKVIGDIAIWYTDMKETVEIGYAFNKKYSGFGYASEALSAVVWSLFRDYAIHRIQANMDARNLASAKLCERIGMRREAHFTQDYWSKGEWTDSYVYAMLEGDLAD